MNFIYNSVLTEQITVFEEVKSGTKHDVNYEYIREFFLSSLTVLNKEK